jgi:hypothetical protein
LIRPSLYACVCVCVKWHKLSFQRNARVCAQNPENKSDLKSNFSFLLYAILLLYCVWSWIRSDLWIFLSLCHCFLFTKVARENRIWNLFQRHQLMTFWQRVTFVTCQWVLVVVVVWRRAKRWCKTCIWI